MKDHYYYPYLANDGKNTIYIINKSEKEYTLELRNIRILQNIRKRQENKHKKMRTGINPVLILVVFGVIDLLHLHVNHMMSLHQSRRV